VEPVHGVGFVGTRADFHGALDGHEDADGFLRVGEFHGYEVEKRIHDGSVLCNVVLLRRVDGVMMMPYRLC